MYIPEEFKQHDSEKTENFIREHPFAMLVSCSGDAPLATHLPLELETLPSGGKVLRGHLAAANPQSRLLSGATAMAVFSGPHAYVSSSWYAQMNVPTWNYMAVHVYGRCRLMTGAETVEFLGKLVSRYEGGEAKPVSLATMPEKYISALAKEIVAFELVQERVEAAWKLSQNRSSADYSNIIRELKKRDPDSVKIAGEMENIRK